MPNLKPKYEKFCREYVIDNNATQAYIRAGYSSSGAGQSAKKLLSNPKIATRVKFLGDEIVRKLSEKHEITQEKILLERARIAFFNAKEVYHADGTVKAPAEWSDDIGAVISGIKASGKDTIEVKICSKDGSLAALEKMHGMYKEDNEQRNPHGKLTDDELDKQITELEEKRARKLKKVVRL